MYFTEFLVFSLEKMASQENDRADGNLIPAVLN